MQDTRLYTVALPGQARTRADSAVPNRVESAASLSSQSSAARPLGTAPGERTLRAQYKGHNADLIARMANELAANSDGLEVIPWFGVDDNGNHSSTETDGYYAVERTERADQEPRAPNSPTVDINLRSVGTRKDVWRALRIQKTIADIGALADTGSGSTIVALPHNATSVQWWDGESQVEPATASQTIATQYDAVDRYILASASFDPAALLYSLPYESEGAADVRLWDTLGEPSKAQLQGTRTTLEWQRVFDSAHEPEGTLHLENGQLRMSLDESDGSIEVKNWNGGAWGTDRTGSSNWSVMDVDILFIGAARLTAHVTFVSGDGSQSYPLRVDVRRAPPSPHWYRPPDRVEQLGSIPSGLVDLLEPTALDRTTRLETISGTVGRGEVR